MLSAAALPRPKPGDVPLDPAGRGRRGRSLGRPAARRGRGLSRSARRRRQDGHAADSFAAWRSCSGFDRAGRGGVRHRDRRRRSGRAGGRGVRRIGGPADDRDRARGARRSGRHVVADRELPRVPLGRVRRGAREPGAPAGAPAGRGDPRHPHHHADRHRHPPGAPRRGRRPAGQDDHPGVRRRMAASRDGRFRPSGRQGHLVRRRAERGRERARPRRAHRRRGELGGAGRHVLLEPRPDGDDPVPGRGAREGDVALPRRPDRHAAEHRRDAAHGGRGGARRLVTRRDRRAERRDRRDRPGSSRAASSS